MKKTMTILAAMAAAGAANGALIISQYYEGASNDKYIEVFNSGSGSIDFTSTSFTLALYSNAIRENWKTSGSTTSTVLLDTGILNSGDTLLFKHSSAANPSYAATLGTASSITNFNGDDSIAIFSGDSTNAADLVDVLGFTSNVGGNTSFTRNSIN
ncbi:MAG: lamin tail domain-containing protein, partial [Verrucomicrobiales bacterium]